MAKTFRVLTLLTGVVFAARIITAQDAGPAYLQIRAVPHGTVQSVAYNSKALGTDRKMMVYTPPGYEKSDVR